MTAQEKIDLGRQAATKLRNAVPTINAIIAGGYPRDIILGAQPKDIDIFINANQARSQAARDQLADRIFDTFGQTWTVDPVEAGLPANPYGPAPEAIEDGFQVYYATTTEGEWEKVNLIFSRNNERTLQFDWSICKAYLYPEGLDFSRSARDLNNVQLLNTSNMPLVVAHAKRIKEKYPEATFRIPTNLLHDRQAYQLLFDGGLLNAPRQVLQAEGEVLAGDQMGFNPGAGDRAEVNFAAAPVPTHVWIDEQERIGQNPNNAWVVDDLAQRGTAPANPWVVDPVRPRTRAPRTAEGRRRAFVIDPDMQERMRVAQQAFAAAMQANTGAFPRGGDIDGVPRF